MPTTSIVDDFTAVEADLNSFIVERTAPIRGCMLALVSGTDIFFQGAPGEGKTFIVDELFLRINGAEKFAEVLNKFTPPEATIGPISFEAAKNDEHKRKIESYLPTSNVAKIDEILEASGSLLISLNPLANERTYKHGTETLQTPLSSIFCMSNRFPESDELAAIYDRLNQRFVVDKVTDTSSFIEIMKLSANGKPAPQAFVEWSDIEIAKKEVAATEVPGEIFTALGDLWNDLTNRGVEASSRRWAQGVPIMQASAFLAGRDEVAIPDIEVYKNILWGNKKQIEDVTDVVLSLANPIASEASKLLTDVRALEDTFNSVLTGGYTSEEKHNQGREIRQKVQAANEIWLDLVKKVDGRPTDALDQVRKIGSNIQERFLVEIMDMKAQEIVNITTWEDA